MILLYFLLALDIQTMKSIYDLKYLPHQK